MQIKPIKIVDRMSGIILRLFIKHSQIFTLNHTIKGVQGNEDYAKGTFNSEKTLEPEPYDPAHPCEW